MEAKDKDLNQPTHLDTLSISTRKTTQGNSSTEIPTTTTLQPPSPDATLSSATCGQQQPHCHSLRLRGALHPDTLPMLQCLTRSVRGRASARTQSLVAGASAAHSALRLTGTVALVGAARRKRFTLTRDVERESAREVARIARTLQQTLRGDDIRQATALHAADGQQQHNQKDQHHQWTTESKHEGGKEEGRKRTVER